MNGNVICKEGGQDCLVYEKGFTTYNVSGTIYYIYNKGGKVIDE